jgi:hypothetical protein
MYDAAESLGADRYLLATIDSWGDPLTNDRVLANLTKWNAAVTAEARRGWPSTSPMRSAPR